MIAFAKLVFVAAAALSAGNEMPWPHMPQVGGESLSSAILPTFSPQHPTVGTQRLCLLQTGVYLITVRVGFRPLPSGSREVTGQLWLKGGDKGEIYLAPLYASAERWNVDGATHQLVVPRTGCYALGYDLDGPATVNEDPRVTYIAVSYMGQVDDSR